MARYRTTVIENVETLGVEPSFTNLTMAQRMIGASICAYGIKGQSGFGFPALYWNPIQATGPVTIVTADAHSSTPAVDAAFITRTKDNWIVLSLRGTEPPSSVHGWDTFKRFVDDWKQDSRSTRVPFFIGHQHYGSVHQGFLAAFDAMRLKIFIALQAVDWSTAKGLQVTGHSKGASLCFLYALWAKYTFPQIKAIEVNAFAPTAVGDEVFTGCYAAAKIPTTRHMRHWDCVPYLLPFHSQTLKSYDFYRYLSWSAINPTEELFHLLGQEVVDGYSTVGNVIFYTNENPYNSTRITGEPGLNQGIGDLLAGIKSDHGIKIADSHSAVNSYYPAVMRP